MINFYAYYNKPLLDHHSKYSVPLTTVGNHDFYKNGTYFEDLSDVLHIVKRDPFIAYDIADTLLRARWVEAEPCIMKDPVWAYRYAKRIVRGRWPEAEDEIMKVANIAYWYSVTVLEHRWLEAEQYIKQDSYFWKKYCNFFGIPC